MSTGSEPPEAARRVAVVGGSGKTGRAVSAALHARAVEVTVIGRAQAADLGGALSGADAVYLIAPNMFDDEPGFVSRMLTAATDAGVPRVGYHSVVAPYAPSMPHHLGKAVAEDAVRRSGLGWTILQPCAYVQNFVHALRSADPVLRVPYSPRSPFGLVDLADVAEAAAIALLSPDHVGATYELGGPERVSIDDVAAAAGAALTRTVPVERTSLAQWCSGEGAALTPRVREWLAAMFEYYDAYGLPAGPLPLATLLGRRPTDIRAVLERELTQAR